MKRKKKKKKKNVKFISIAAISVTLKKKPAILSIKRKGVRKKKELIKNKRKERGKNPRKRC